MTKTWLYTAQCNTLSTWETRVVSHLKMRNSTWKESKANQKLLRHNESSNAYRNPASWNWLPKQKHPMDICYVKIKQEREQAVASIPSLSEILDDVFTKFYLQSKGEKLMNIDDAWKPCLKKKNNGFVPKVVLMSLRPRTKNFIEARN